MTLGDMKFMVLAGMEYAGAGIHLDGPTVIRAINESMQALYPAMLKDHTTFFTKSVPFSSTTSIGLPIDFKDILLIRIPAASGSGGARMVSHREYQSVVNNIWQTPVASNPVATLKSTSILLSPAAAGTLFYIASIPDVTLETQELSARTATTQGLVPRQYEEAVYLKTLVILAKRGEGQPGDATEARLDFMQKTEAQLEIAMQPQAVFNRDMELPK